MIKSGEPNRKDAALVGAAKAFAKAFGDAAASGKPPTAFSSTTGRSLGAAGVVEITEEVAITLAALRTRSMKLLGSKAGHERAVEQTLLKQAHESILDSQSVDGMATALIDAVFDQGLVSNEYVAPNRLFRFAGGVRSIRIGSVRAMQTIDLQHERQSTYPGGRVTLAPGDGFSMKIHPGGAVTVTIYGVCWVIDVDAIAENVQEEGRWLIDVAVSLLRLTHTPWQGLPPKIGDREPHPIHPTIAHNDGVKLQGPTVLAGGGRVLPWYEIDAAAAASAATSEFLAKASAIFAPTKDSLAARVSQGLGWLSRGRQSPDRAERLLYFFTAIEALLSGADKSAPVVQTIARHAAVLLSNDNAERERHASLLRALYGLRSALVHNGNRGIDWTAANASQEYAEAMFYVVLLKASLSSKHETFNNELAAASYGLAWPPAA